MNVPFLAAVSKDIDGDNRVSPNATIGADEVKANDLDIVSMFPYVIGFYGNNNVSMTLINKGYNTLTSGTAIYLQYQADGGSWVSQTLTLSSNLGINQTVNFTFSTPWNVSSYAQHSLCVRINPQISGDPDGGDQLCSTIKIGLAGTYYIDPSGAGNYLSFSAAANDLTLKGVAGACTFIVRPAVYTERVVLPTLLGTSATNTIVFDGGSKYSVYLNYTGSNTSPRATVLFSGADYVTFKNMTVQNYGTSYGAGFIYTNASDYNTIDNCDIRVDFGEQAAIYNLLPLLLLKLRQQAREIMQITWSLKIASFRVVIMAYHFMEIVLLHLMLVARF